MSTIKFISLLLALVMLASCFTGCVIDEEGAQKNASSTDATEGKESGTPADSTETLEQKKSRIKQSVIALMEDSQKQDPEELFGAFCGDYVLSGFASSGDSAMLNKVYQKDGVTVNQYSDGINQYVAVKGGYIFTVVEQNGSFRLYSANQYGDADSHVPSIFDDFGIDISGFYGKKEEGDSENDDDFPELTADDLTVSDDLKKCTLSATFMKEVLRSFGKTFGKTDTELDVFVNLSSASGVYSVESNTVTLELLAKGFDMANGAEVDEAKITVSYCESQTDGITMTMKMEMTMNMNMDGTLIKAPAIMEQTVSGVKYDGNKVVAAKFETKMSTDIETTISGVSVKSAVYEANSFELSIEDLAKPRLFASCSSEQTTTVGGTKTTEKTSQTLDCTFGASASKFSYVMTQDGTQAAKIEATGASLGASAESIPSEVINIINQELAKLNT